MLAFLSAPNKFAVQGSHDALVHLSGTLRTLAVSLYKIGNDTVKARSPFAEGQIRSRRPDALNILFHPAALASGESNILIG